jgi:hypothetical protein
MIACATGEQHYHDSNVWLGLSDNGPLEQACVQQAAEATQPSKLQVIT